MTDHDIHTLINLLKSKGVSFEAGLTDKELHRIYHEFNVSFPNDLRRLLQTALPVSDKFVDWRKGLNSFTAKQDIDRQIDWPLEGLYFDVENNDYWQVDWGEKPVSLDQQKAIVASHYYRAPQLIPVYAHRYIPNEPCEDENAVLSVYQTDIIIYGNNLAHYFANEFSFALPDDIQVPERPRLIAFWDAFLS